MPNSSPIVAPETMFPRLGAIDLRIVDVRWVMGSPGAGRAAYDAGHIPGAIFVDLDTDLAAPPGAGRHPLPTPASFRERMEAAGIGSNHEVVAYDDASGGTAARLWWMLDNLGHDRVRILDGGLSAWIAAGLPVTNEPASPRPRGHLDIADAWTNIIDRGDLAGRLGEVVLLDGRAAPRYRGEVEPIDAVPGHIPTARLASVTGSLGSDGRMLDADSLRARFESLGADGGPGSVVTSCGSGVTACHTSLAMRIAGLPDPILYAGSYSDWTRARMPIVTGPAPGEPPPRA